MTVDIRPATLRDACYCAANMRPEDRAEIDAVVPLDNPAGVAWQLLESSGDLAFVAYLGNQPVAVFGTARLFQHVSSGWAYGTNRMRRVLPAMTRHCLGYIAPTLAARGYRRLEIRAMESNALSCRWIEGMGFKRETPVAYEYGRHGEMFVTFGYGLTDYLKQKEA